MKTENLSGKGRPGKLTTHLYTTLCAACGTKTGWLGDRSDPQPNCPKCGSDRTYIIPGEQAEEAGHEAKGS